MNPQADPPATPALEAVRDRAGPLAQLLDQLPVGFFVTLPGGQPVFANREAIRLLGRDATAPDGGQTLAQAYHEFIAGTDDPYPNERTETSRGLAGEASHAGDVEIRRDDGTRVRMEVWWAPLFDPSGSVACVVAAFRDVTEARAAHAALAAQAALLEFAHDAILEWDAQGLVTYWNSAAERILWLRKG